jgi:FkbM family methyltransferase
MRFGFGKKKYPELHYLKDIIKEGDICIDIGANMGYYSFFMSEYCGSNGRVYAVEPVPLFVEIWKKNVSRTNINNATMFQYALGSEDKNVRMGMPVIDGVVHHGMTKVVSDEDIFYEKFFNAQMVVPDELFKDIEKVDFIKVDIEGYEHVVFDNMRKTLSKHKPLIQCELSGNENRKQVIKILQELGYKPYIHEDRQLINISEEEIETYEGDFYFKTENN